MKTILTTVLAILVLAALPGARRDAAAAGPPEYLKEGRGEFEMVLIHDLGSNAKVWKDIEPYMRSTFKLWEFELSGHGATPPVEHPTIKSEADRLGAFLDAQDIAYPTLVGHGVGGMIALRYTIDHPSRVHRLILMDTTAQPLTTPDEQVDFAAKLASNYDETVARRYLAMSPKPEVTDRILDDALRTDSASFISLLMSTNDFDVTHQLAGLTVPLLIVGSELMFPEGVDARAILEQVGFGHAQSLSFKRMPQTGHFMMLERPVYLASVLLAFGVTADYEFDN